MTFTKTHKRLVSVFFALAALVVFFINALLIFVVTGPRSLNSITPYIESALAPKGSPYQVKIESSQLIWDGWRHPIAIHTKNVEILDNKGVIVAHFPEVGVSMYFFKLLVGEIDLKSLEVIHPTALLIQGDDGNISLGFTQAENAADTSISSVFSLLTADAGSNPVTHLKSLLIKHADITVKKAHGGILLHSPDASLEIIRRNNSARGSLSMPLQFDKRSSQLDIDFGLSRNNKSVSAEAVYTDIPSAVLQQLFPSQHWMESASMPLSGWAHVIADFDANISTLDFVFEGGPGTFEYPSLFETPFQIQRIRLEGGLTDKLSTLTVKKGILDFKTAAISFNGTARKQGDDYGVEGYAETANVPTNDVHRYWPVTLSPHTRKWVVNHISEGKIEKANIKFHFKPGDFKLKDIPDEDLSATIEMKGATIKYMPKHPEITDINGTVKFTGESMDATVTHGNYMSGSTINSGRVRFPDFAPSDVRLFLDVDVNAPAKDVVEFMSLPDLDKAKLLNLTTSATGQLKGTAKLDFIAFSDNESSNNAAGHINYNIAADLIGVSQNNFMGKRDVADANMKISLNNKSIKATGRARVNQIPMSIDLTNNFGHDHETTYAIKADIPVSRLPDFDIPALDCTKGTLGVNATFISSDSVEKAEATVDLAQASISLPEHGFSKKVGDKAILKVTTEKLPSGNTLISPFYLKGNDYSVSGKAEYSRAAGEFASINLDSLHFGNDDLSYLNYAKLPHGVKLDAKGRSFDVEPYLLKKGKSNTLDTYIINLKADQLILANGRSFNNADIQTDCSGICNSVDISAKLSDGTPFNYTIHNGVLNASTDNAGELVRTLGITDTISGGKLALKGAYKDSKIEGLLEMTNYNVKNASVLTKIFTIASLTGILDTLTGNGISFTRLSAPFAYQRNVIILKDAKAHGPAIGITADGVINMNEATIDLSGSLVPSYTMNSLIGNIPLIGSVLMGGTGKGIIAINYSVKGEMKDPSISVNPLSVLTPGFLRNVFDIFDEPAPDFDKIEAEQKKADEKKKQQEEKPAVTAPANPVPAKPDIPAASKPAALPSPALLNADDPNKPNK